MFTNLQRLIELPSFATKNRIGPCEIDRVDTFILFVGDNGIGRTLVKRVNEVQSGKIWVESMGLNCGNTFLFTLPAPRDES